MIEGIHDYCNRWCERCPFTDRCAVALTEQDYADLLDDGEAEDPAEDFAEDLAGRSADFPYHEALEDPLAVWAEFFHHRARSWVDAHAALAREPSAPPAVREAVEVVGWNSILGWTKLLRAFLAEEYEDREDAAGSAKVSRLAYADIREALRRAEPHLGDRDTADLLRSVEWAPEQIDGRFPRNRSFRRPGFDAV